MLGVLHGMADANIYTFCKFLTIFIIFFKLENANIVHISTILPHRMVGVNFNSFLSKLAERITLVKSSKRFRTKLVKLKTLKLN